MEIFESLWLFARRGNTNPSIQSGWFNLLACRFWELLNVVQAGGPIEWGA
jgi:hypothetical protein